MSKSQRIIDDQELIERYYSNDYACKCMVHRPWSKYWCPDCKVIVEAAIERQEARGRIKVVLDEIILNPCDTEWSCAVDFSKRGWEVLCAKIMEAV